MKLNLEINNKSRSPLKKVFFTKIIQKTLAESGLDFLQKKNVSLSLALVAKDEMREVNKQYRRINAVTDVLSFSEYKNTAEIKKSANKELFLGELILCYDDIVEYSQKEKLNLKEELVRVVSHGTLHLLGWRHGKKMFALQDEIAQAKFSK